MWTRENKYVDLSFYNSETVHIVQGAGMHEKVHLIDLAHLETELGSDVEQASAMTIGHSSVGIFSCIFNMCN